MVSVLNGKVTQLTGKKPTEAIKKRPYIPSLQLLSTDLPGFVKNGSPPWPVVSYLYTWWTWRWKEKSHRCVLVWKNHIKKTLPSPINRFGIICTTAPSVALLVRNFLSCLSTPSCRPSHSISHSSRSQGSSSWMWYNGGCVNSVYQNTVFFIIGTQPQLILFISTHHTSLHSQSSVSGGIYPPPPPSSTALHQSQCNLIRCCWTPFEDSFTFSHFSFLPK